MVELQRLRDSSDQENLARVKEHISREGVSEVLERVNQKFVRQPGFLLFYGISPDGLVVGVRKGCVQDAFSPDYFKAMAVDIKLPVDQIEQKIAETSFSYMSVDTYRDGGTTIFPGKEMSATLAEVSKMPDEEIKSKYPDDERLLPLITFYRQTGGFRFPTPLEPGGRPSVGGRTVYPLNLS